MDPINKKASAEAEMTIRKPVAEVFEAFLDPSITTNFWFTKSTGKLQEGKSVTWTWEMYGVSTVVRVLKIIHESEILIEWGDPPTKVHFALKAIEKDLTYVSITHFDFNLTGDDLIAAIKDSTGGFTNLLAGLKAFLEHGLKLNLTGDKYPEELRK